MHVKRIALTDFRNYQNESLSLFTGSNLLVGGNGQGKTNLAEAIAYFSTLGSHRVSQDSALIRTGQSSATVRLLVAYREREMTLEVELNRSGINRAQINGNPAKSRELPRWFRSVVFAPEDLAIVRGEPAGRRRFINELLIQLSPRLSGVIADYERVLRQRNTLLKSARTTARTGQLSTLEIWDERLVGLGSEIIESRAAVLERLRPHLDSGYRSIVGNDHHPRLRSSLSIDGADDEAGRDAPAGEGPVPERFREALARARAQELERGLSLIGPHRDDVFFGLNDLPVRGYASHGESWSFALALRLGAAQLLRENSPSGDPVVILDDVFAELDENRRSRLAGAVGDFEQVLITAAVLDDVPAELTHHVVHIHGGRVGEAIP